MTRKRIPGPYLPIDINFDANPKIAALTDGAFRLHLSGMLWCKRLRVDGIIPPAIVPRLVPKYRPSQLRELVDRMLWVELNGSGHYGIHDWEEWNLTGEEARERSAAARAAAQKRWEE